MLAILSPAKDMKVHGGASYPTKKYTIPEFLVQSKGLISDLKKFKRDELSELMKISDKLALLNFDRFKNWKQDHHAPEYASPAILAFMGEAYRGLRAADFEKDNLEYAQGVLRIFSGLYGVLKPLDLILEYRLEMGTKSEFRGKKNLYEFWKLKLTEAVSVAVKESPGEKVLINLASSEYSSAIDQKKFKYPVLTPSFYQEKDGKLKMVAVYAKRARGMMSRFIIENQLEKVEELKAFDLDGYYFEASRSDENRFVFVR